MNAEGLRSRTAPDRAPYLIELRGDIDPRWVAWFDAITVTDIRQDEYGPVTTFQFSELDQAKLRGILTRLWDLNLMVVSVRRLSPPGGPAVETAAGSA